MNGPTRPWGAVLLALASGALAVTGVLPALAQAEPSPAPTALKSVPVANVTVLDRGEKPRRTLRYSWAVGQKEAQEIDLTMATETSRGLSSSGDVQAPTIRMTATTEVVEAFPDGTWLLEQVVHDAGVPLGEAEGILDAEVAQSGLSGLIGLTVRTRVDDRGRVHESAIITPPTMDPAEAETIQNGARTMEGLLFLLPAERVGKGALWRVNERLVGPMAIDLKQVRRNRLVRIEDDVLHLATTVRQSAGAQSVDVPDTPEGFDMRIDTHDARGSGTVVLDLGAVAHESSADVESNTELTARSGKQAETLIVTMDIDTVTRKLPLGDLPDPQARQPVAAAVSVRRHEVDDQGLAIAFPSRWSVDATNRDDHAWLYSEDEVDDDPYWYGILIAGGDAQKCTVQDNSGWAKDQELGSVDEIVSVEFDWYQRDSDAKDANRRFYDMPAGRVGRVDVDWFNGTFESFYWYTHGQQVIGLNCWATHPPDDLWLPIADSLEFLTAAPRAATPLTYLRAPADPADAIPALSTLRIDRPDAGYAITFPLDWTVREAVIQGSDGLMGEIDEDDLRYQRPLLRADANASDSFCLLADVTGLAEWNGWASTRELGSARQAELRGATQFSDSTVSHARRPDGEATSVQSMSTDGRGLDEWFVERSGRWLHLACWSRSPTEDGSKSIAATLGPSGFRANAPGATVTAEPSATPSPGPIEASVPAASAEGILVGDWSVGDVVIIGAAGEWCASDAADDCGGPEGAGEEYADVHSDHLVGALMAQQSGSDQVRLVGVSAAIDITSPGPLRLFFNDKACCYDDNRGEMYVFVELLEL